MGNSLSSTCHRLKTHSPSDSGFLEHAEVTSELLNGKIESVSNECCGEAKNLLKKADTTKDHAIDDEQNPDGWLTRRHEDIGSVTVKFCSPSKVYGFDIDTTGFDNSCPSNATVELFRVSDNSWQPILSGASLRVNTHNLFSLKSEEVYSRIRLSVVPAGGIARLRVYGQITPDFSDKSQEHNFASAALGARIVRWTDNTYGNKPNILLDNGMKISDGWLSPRSKLNAPRNDHLIIQLAHSCKISSIHIDTAGFEYNSPTHVSVDACFTKDDDPSYDIATRWSNLVNKKPIKTNAVTVFSYEDSNSPLKDDVFSHIKLRVIPDGGIQQIKVYGTPACESDKKTVLLIESAPTANITAATTTTKTTATTNPNSTAATTQTVGEIVAVKLEDNLNGYGLLRQANFPTSNEVRQTYDQHTTQEQQQSPTTTPSSQTLDQRVASRSSRKKRKALDNNGAIENRKAKKNSNRHNFHGSKEPREPGEIIY